VQDSREAGLSAPLPVDDHYADGDQLDGIGFPFTEPALFQPGRD